MPGASPTGATGEHDIDMLSVSDYGESGLVEPASLVPVLQLLHEQAHPDGTAYWYNCRESGCTEATELTGI